MRNIFRNTTPAWNKVGSIKVDWAITIWIYYFIISIAAVIGLKKCSSLLFRLSVAALVVCAIPVHVASTLYYIINAQLRLQKYKGYKYFFTVGVRVPSRVNENFCKHLIFYDWYRMIQYDYVLNLYLWGIRNL